MNQIIENTKYIKSDICGHYQDIKTDLQKLADNTSNLNETMSKVINVQIIINFT
jgi:hypothetical protein